MLDEPLELEAPKLHDVKLIRKTDRSCAKVEVVPPEEFGISRSAKIGYLHATPYCFHETEKREYELLDMGFDADSVSSLPDTDFNDEDEAQSRDTVSDREDGTGTSNLNRPNRLLQITEHYIRLEYEKEGDIKLYRVTTAGESGTVLDRDGKPAIDEIEDIAFASTTPFPMTHRFFGRSLADLVMDIQRIKTAILRALLDNMYLANNGRTEIAESHASKHTIDDLLTNRPGGIVRTKQPGGLMPIPNSEIGSFGYPLLEYLDKEREERTGIAREGQGLGSDSLKNVGQEVLLSMFNMAQAKMRLIARIIAETGVRDMFLLLHKITRREATKADTVRLRGEWVDIDPNSWRRRDDMTVNVGLGSGSKPQQIAFLTSLLGLQQEAIAASFPGVGPKHVYNTVTRLVEANGFKSVDPFMDDPETLEQTGEEQQDPALMEAQAKLQLQAQESQEKLALQAKQGEAKLTLEVQRDQARAQFDAQQAEVKAQADAQRAAMDAQNDAERIRLEHAAQMAKINAEFTLRREQMAMERDLKREQIATEAQVKVGTAAMHEVSEQEKASTEVSDVRMGGEVG